MANDKHFRVKNGVKVGDTEVITSSAKVVASTIEVASVILPTKISTIETTLSSLSAALGTYTDSLVTSSLIGDLKLTASSNAATALLHRQSASASRSAALSAKNDTVTFRGNALNAKDNAEDDAQKADDARVLAEGYRLDACSHEAAAQGAKSDANVALLLSQSSRDAAILSLSSANSAKRASDRSASDANAAKITAQSHKNSSDNHASDANAARILAQSHRDAANLSKSAAEVAKTSAEAFRDAANLAKSASNVAKLASENAQSLADDARSDANAAQILATSHKNTADNARSDALAANTLAGSHRDAADNARSDAVVARVSAQDAKGLADTAKTNAQNAASDALATALTASGSLVTIESNKTSSQNAASDTLASKTSASTALVAVQLSESTASSALSTTLEHRTSALNASTSAKNAASDALVSQASASSLLIDITTVKTTASTSLTTTQNHQTKALSARNAASNAASDALVSEASATNTKGRIDTIEQTASNSLVTTQTYQTNALSAKTAAENAASNSLVSEAAANSTKGRIDTIEQTASNSLVTTQGYESNALNSKTSASNAASNALVSEASASDLLVTITTAKTTASSAAATATESKTTAVQASTNATNAASDAAVSKASASNLLVSVLSAKTTASSAAASSLEFKQSALNSSNAASDNAAASLLSKQSADTSASDIGALTSQIADVRLLEARVTNGMNGHYAGNHWYLDTLGTGCSETSAMVTALADGGAIYLETVPSGRIRERVSNGDFSNGLTGWSEADFSNEATEVGGEGVLTQTDGAAYIYQTITVDPNVQHTISFDLLSYTGSQPYLMVGTTGEGSFDLVAATPSNPAFPLSVGRNTYTFTPTTTTATVTVYSFGSNGGNTAVMKFDNISVKLNKTTKIIESAPKALVNYPIAGLTGTTGPGSYRVYSTTPIAVTHPNGRMAVPANFSDERLGLYANRYFPVKCMLFSPFNDASIDVYIKTDTSGAQGIFTEGVTPVNHTFTIPKGSYYSWSSGQVTGMYSEPTSDADELSVVFRGDTKILGLAGGTTGDFVPLVPLSNSEVLSTSYGDEYKYPRVISGGGINLESLEFALIEAGIGGSLQSDAPNLYSKIVQSNGGYEYGDFNQDSVSNSGDANILQSYRANNSSVTSTQKQRIEELIDHLNNNYSSLETSFSSGGVVYTLYDNAPETNTSICSILGGVQLGAAYHTPDSIRNHIVTTGIADGSGGDAEVGLPRQALSDFYVLPRNTITNYRLATVEPNDIKVSDSEGTVLRTHSLRNASKANPLSACSNTASTGSGIDFGSGKGPYTFVGTNPFYLVCQSTAADEVTMFGALQGILNGEITQTAVGTQISQVSSAVDSNTVTITQTSESVNGLQGQYTVKIDNNGFASGFGLASTTASSTNATSAFVVQADKFAVVDPSYSGGISTSISSIFVPFEISGGVTKIKNANIGKLTANNIATRTLSAKNIVANTLTSAEIGANAITSNEIAANSVKTSELAAGAVTSNSIAANAITAGMIAADTIKGRELFETNVETLNYDPTFRDDDSLTIVAYGQENTAGWDAEDKENALYRLPTNSGLAFGGRSLKAYVGGNQARRASWIAVGEPFIFDFNAMYELSYYSDSGGGVSTIDSQNLHMAVGIAYYDTNDNIITTGDHSIFYFFGERGVHKELAATHPGIDNPHTFTFGEFGGTTQSTHKHPSGAIKMAPVIGINLDANGDPIEGNNITGTSSVYSVKINRLTNKNNLADGAVTRNSINKSFYDNLIYTGFVGLNANNNNSGPFPTDYLTTNNLHTGSYSLFGPRGLGSRGQANAYIDPGTRNYISTFNISNMEIKIKLSNNSPSVERSITLYVALFDDANPFGTTSIINNKIASISNDANFVRYLNGTGYSIWRGKPSDGNQDLRYYTRSVSVELDRHVDNDFLDDNDNSRSLYWAYIFYFNNIYSDDIVQISELDGTARLKLSFIEGPTNGVYS